ncbi:hypothetical protein TNCV_4730111 [Trichonephila clavipes]|nr:hypothetical protein TNCV_4730111 [Trichonephila clavipes]
MSSDVERTCFPEDEDVTAETFCDPAFVDQETVRDTFVGQLCRYHLHCHACYTCLHFSVCKVSHRRLQHNWEWRFPLLRCIMLKDG